MNMLEKRPAPRKTTTEKPYDRKGKAPKKKPGRVVGVIACRPKDLEEGDFNPLVMYWTVNQYRKDFNSVIDQQEKPRRLPKYSQSLFHSCFKNW